ncbi:AhpA/YtjB family protein [Algicola sagamiensis]|uniref:AhpA/YtjB family protein n=1 Tax=Algicola sagamiensis TaxID=163869 RepID=UPI0003807230|nr:AhpA/YtjB family protein [Algicola sagamiensis]
MIKKLWKSLLVIGLGFVVFFGWHQVLQEKSQIQMTQSEQVFREMLGHSSNLLQTALSQNNKSMIESLCLALVQSPMIEDVILHNPNGTIVYQTPHALLTKERFRYHPERAMKPILQEIRDEERNILGYLKVSYNFKDLELTMKMMNQPSDEYAWLFLIFAVNMGIIIARMLSQIITERLY